jgi:hypothetical protein
LQGQASLQPAPNLNISNFLAFFKLDVYRRQKDFPHNNHFTIAYCVKNPSKPNLNQKENHSDQNKHLRNQEQLPDLSVLAPYTQKKTRRQIRNPNSLSLSINFFSNFTLA